MKKIILIALTAALLLSLSACKGKDEKKDGTETNVKYVDVTNADGTPVTDENGNTVTEAIVETVSSESDTADEGEVSVIPDGTVIEPNADPVDPDDPDEYADGYIQQTDEAGETYYEPVVMPEQEEISQGGAENVEWPSELPTEIPQFTKYTEMDRVTFEDYGDYGFWSTGFTTTEENYDEYIALLESNGFVKSDRIFAVWGKGNVTIDLSPENDGDSFWTNFEITKVNDFTVPADFYAFETDQAIYSLETDDGYISVDYECGSDFNADADAYLETLAANGFTVNGDTATKGNYVCTINRTYTTVTYTF